MNSVPTQAESHPLHSAVRRPALVAILLAAGLVLRLLFVLRGSRISGDTMLYGDLALNLLHRHSFGFTGAAGQPTRLTMIRLPGYPGFLAVCFALFGAGNYLAVMLVQCAADLLDCWLMAALARRLFGPRAFLPALALATLCPFTANYVACPLTETLVLLMMTVSFYALIRLQQARWQRRPDLRSGWLYLLAFALGYSILLRPEQGLLAAALAPAVLWICFRSGQPGPGPNSIFARLAPAIVVFVLTLSPLVPWTIRNERVFHQFQPLAPRSAADPGELVPNGFYRWYRTIALDFASTETAYWPFNSDPINVADLPNRAFDSNSQYAATAALLDDYNQTTTVTPALDARFEALARERVEDNPVRYYVALPLGRTLDMALRPRTELLPIPLEWWKPRGHVVAFVAAVALAVLNLAYIVMAVLGWRRLRTHTANPILYAMAATIFLRCLVLLTLDNSEPRYTLEFFPVLIPLAAGWLASLTSGNPLASSESCTASGPLPC